MTKKWPYFDQIMTKKWPFFESERENNDQKMTFLNIFKFFSGVNILPFWLLDSYRMGYLFPHGTCDAGHIKNEK